MNETEKILELLEKAELTLDERNELESLLAAIPGSDKLVKTYTGLKYSLAADSHIDENLLGEYVLFKNSVLGENQSMLLLERKIEDHLRGCEKCINIFKDLNSEYANVDSFLTESIKQSEPKDKTKKNTVGFFQKLSAGKFAFASIVTILVVYVGLFAASSVFTPDYKKYAIASDERNLYNTRGRTSELFQRGLNAIDQKDYKTAIQLLEEDINKNSGEPSIFYSHFILGVTYIQESESSFLGTFKSFNKEKVENGITSLKKAIALNNSNRYENLNLDAHYFIGKAYLLIDQDNLAANHLRIVVNNKGSYYKKAEALLGKISKR